MFRSFNISKVPRYTEIEQEEKEKKEERKFKKLLRLVYAENSIELKKWEAYGRGLSTSIKNGKIPKIIKITPKI